MRSLALTAFFFCLILAGCGHGGRPAATVPPADTAKYYSLDAFYRSQLDYVELRNFPIYRIRILNGKKDSAAFSKDDFAALASSLFRTQTFLPRDKAMYKETVFEDQSTDSYTLNYTATDPAPAVRSVDILLDRASNAVKRVFVKSSYRAGRDTTVEQVFGIKAFKSMQLNRTITAKGYRSTELNYINWNDK
ncbi:MAG: hypothetical protein JO301_06185 [Chitinophagaceae bacterium]|nr:hypothetical protein [Chitinophagaceae bacterium]